MDCSKCGKKNNSDDSKFCEKCGNSLSDIAVGTKKNTTLDSMLDEDDNNFLDVLNIPRKDNIFVKSCKLCIIRNAMKNQISEYEEALSSYWLTDDEWLQISKEENKAEIAGKLTLVLTGVIGATIRGIIAVFKILITIIVNIFDVIFSLLSIIISLAVLAVVLAIVDHFVHFSQYITPVVEFFNTIKNFVSEHYIAGLVAIGVILLIVSVITLVRKNTEKKQSQYRELLEYQYRRDEGLKKQKEAEKNLEIANLMYGVTTKILTKMNECRESVPPEYWDNADSLWYLYQSRRANTVQEAINLLEEILYQSRMEEKMDKSLEMANENRRTIEEIKKISSDARDFSENAMLYAQQATNAAYSAASAARDAEWAAWSAKWEVKYR